MEYEKLKKKFDENGYVICQDLIENNEMLDFIGVYAYNLARVCGTVSNDSDVPGSPSFYGDFVMENLGFFLQNKIEKITGTPLLQTYAFLRVYKYGDSLRAHIDRPACEISVTLCLRYPQNEKIYPIYIDNTKYKKSRNMENGGVSQANLEMGSALIYRGCECSHWRNKYTEGTKLAQVFLHYVDANGDSRQLKNDGRKDKFSLYL